MGKPSISVLIDTYNHERFMEQATIGGLEQDFQARSEKRAVIPGVPQVDGGGGSQTVEKRINPRCWRLIAEFEKHTGVSVLLNTASNLRGEAIVDTPTDANRTFFSPAMHALVLGSFLIEK